MPAKFGRRLLPHSSVIPLQNDHITAPLLAEVTMSTNFIVCQQNLKRITHTLTRMGICCWDAIAKSVMRQDRPAVQCSRRTYEMNPKSTLNYKQYTHKYTYLYVQFVHDCISIKLTQGRYFLYTIKVE